MRSSSAATSSGAQHARQRARRAWARRRARRGSGATVAVLAQRPEERAQRGELARDGRRRAARARTARRRSGAACAGSTRAGLERPARAPRRRTGRGRCRRRGASSRPRRGGAGRRRSSAQGRRARPARRRRGGLASGAVARLLHRHVDAVRSRPSASSSRRASRRDGELPPRPWHRDPGHGRRVDDVVRGAAQAGAGRLHRHARPSPRRPPRPARCERGWEEVAASSEIAAGAGVAGSGDVDRAPRPGPRRRARSTSGIAHADAAVRGGGADRARRRRCRGCRRRRRCPSSAP